MLPKPEHGALEQWQQHVGPQGLRGLPDPSEERRELDPHCSVPFIIIVFFFVVFRVREGPRWPTMPLDLHIHFNVFFNVFSPWLAHGVLAEMGTEVEQRIWKKKKREEQ